MTATLQRLSLDSAQFGVAGQHLPAIRAALARGLPEFIPSLVAHDGTMAIAGSGPSLPAFLDDLKEERRKGRPVLAVNGAHDLLCEHGIQPDVFVTVDPRDIRHNLRQKNDYTIYLLASRAAPEVFDHLKNCRIVLWHSAGHPTEMPAFHGTNVKKIGGGPTSGLRAICLAYLMGFRHMVLYGMDSCNDAEGRKRFDSGTVANNMDVMIDGRIFNCNMAMAAQAESFQFCTYGMLPGLTMDAKGDGLIAAIIAERKKAGFRA